MSHTHPVRSPRLVCLALFVSSIAALGACNEPKPAPKTEPTSATTAASAALAATAPQAPAEGPAIAKAEVGKPAPDFELRDTEGASVKLSSFKGKVVVLEWWNPGCPFVKAAHTKGSLKTAAKDASKKGVVWLAINSNGEGKQGFGAEANRAGKKAFDVAHPVLLDESGAVGHAYGATNTPHIMIVDEAGTLVYRGAADNSPDGEGESPEGGKLVSYVDATLADLAAKRPVAKPETRAYGCSVKYAQK